MSVMIPPAAARMFRAAVGKCRPTRARDPSPPLVLARTRAGVLTLFANLGEIGLSLTVPGKNSSGTAVIPLNALETPNGIDLSESHKDDAPVAARLARHDGRNAALVPGRAARSGANRSAG